MFAGPTTAEVIADSFVAAQVERVYAYPGDPTIELLEQTQRRGINVVLARREGTAGFMAEAEAMASGRLGVCVSTLGPGSTALVNGVAAATLDRVPMLAISGQIETAREQFFTHQVVDHGRLFGPVTKWAGRIEAAAVVTTLRKAMSLANAERPGAVHLTINADTSKKPAQSEVFELPPLAWAARSVSINADADPLGMLAGTRRPVILAGIGAVRAGAGQALAALSEQIGAPVVVSPMAKGIIREDHPLFAGVLDMACNQIVWDFLAEADLLVAVGFDAVELIKPWPLHVPVLHIDALPNTDQIYASSCECVGDIGAIASWFVAEWQGEQRWSEAEVGKHRLRLRNAYYSGRIAGALNPTDVVDVVRTSVPRDALATTDVGSHKLLVGQGWQTYEPRSTLMTNGLSAMGFGVPAAVASKLAQPARPVVALVGDGGFAMTATELRMASAAGLGIVCVVFVDGSLNRIELKQMAQGYASTATRIEDMNLVTLAEAMNCDGVRVRSRRELERALSSVADLSRPLIVEARVDPGQYQSQF